MQKYKFIDLFAGLGGFNIALKKYGAQCVFASEIDIDLRRNYENNFGIKCHGDITQINVEDIPKHDILCAGFPCQSFSKAGRQKGLADKGRGDMIHEIIRILQHHHPKHFILENVPNLKKHDQGNTWKYIIDSLKQCNYQIQDFILSPHHFGIPHRRERIFIIGTLAHEEYKILDFTNRKVGTLRDIRFFLDKGGSTSLSRKQIDCLEIWQNFIDSLPSEKPMPKFPIWSMEFGANYPLHEKCPYYKTQKELESYKGSFGCSLKGFSKPEQLNRLPVYARYKQHLFPKWKINYINKNRKFWEENKGKIKHCIPKLKTYINSWQKLEWNAGDEERNIFKHVLQFRSSGIRIKSNCSIPSLVLTRTQTPVIGWEKRYLTICEAQEFQGFKSIQLDLLTNRKILSALGNAVNTIVLEEIFKHLCDVSTQEKNISMLANHQMHVNEAEIEDRKYSIRTMAGK